MALPVTLPPVKSGNLPSHIDLYRQIRNRMHLNGRCQSDQTNRHYGNRHDASCIANNLISHTHTHTHTHTSTQSTSTSPWARASCCGSCSVPTCHCHREFLCLGSPRLGAFNSPRSGLNLLVVELNYHSVINYMPTELATVSLIQGFAFSGTLIRYI